MNITLSWILVCFFDLIFLLEKNWYFITFALGKELIVLIAVQVDKKYNIIVVKYLRIGRAPNHLVGLLLTSFELTFLECDN